MSASLIAKYLAGENACHGMEEGYLQLITAKAVDMLKVKKKIKKIIKQKGFQMNSHN